MADPEASTSAKLLNRTVGGFELLSVLGEGGMGTVYKARQAGLDRIVALKILSPKIANNQTFITRFQREARASAKLNHPNVVQGIDVGHDDEHDVWYFAMEYVNGPSVLSLLKDTGKIPEIRALEIARDVARALECAARNGIVHRDIKPDNVLMTLQGEAKLADLGLARHVEEDVGITAEDRAIGTPLYMAPEQARGNEQEIDLRSDIYALGATMYHMVTGRPPFEGKTAAVIMTKHITDPPPLAHVNSPGVSGATARLIEKMMQKKREERVQTPSEVLKEIERNIAALKSPATQGSRSVRLGKPRTVSVRMPPIPVMPETGPSGSNSRLKAEGTAVPVTETKSAKQSSRRLPAVAASEKPATPAPWPPSPTPPEKKIEAPPESRASIQRAEATRSTGRVTLTERRKKEKGEAKKRTVEGLLIDIVVLAVVLGVVAAGLIYLRGHGYLRMPGEGPTQEKPQGREDGEPEAKSYEPKPPEAKSSDAKTDDGQEPAEPAKSAPAETKSAPGE
ncbi:MAG: protein kinase [Planctomycetota bacterium]|nr:protein kinase [Planctomycetota bacterium]